MLRAASCILLVLTGLSGCLGGLDELRDDRVETTVRYWELVTSLEWEGQEEPVILNQGPHCPWLEHRGDRLTLLRARDDPPPAGHALGRTWSGELPNGSTFGGGFHGWLHDGTIYRTVGGEPLMALTWAGDTPVLDGERGFDGWNRTTEYEFHGMRVAETVALHDRGTLPLTVRTEDELHCD